MAFRFHKSFNVGFGRVNFAKKSMSFSTKRVFGTTLNTSTTGKVKSTVSIWGTGLSYIKFW